LDLEAWNLDRFPSLDAIGRFFARLDADADGVLTIAEMGPAAAELVAPGVRPPVRGTVEPVLEPGRCAVAVGGGQRDRGGPRWHQAPH
jgi:hypothetical protein